MKKWQDIDGWFSEYDAQVYRIFVDSLKDGSHILELGAYKGRSTLCLAQTIRESGKNIKIHVVDTFAGDAHIGEADTFHEFTENLCPYKDLLASVNVGLSTEICEDWETKLDAIYIDASHDYKSVCADIEGWMPHLRIGGLMGGHDYNFKGVYDAVNENMDNVEVYGTSWLCRL